MSWLNYHHLYYFWCVVRDGGLAGAGRRLRLAESTISAQVRTLETNLGEPLFERTGRRLRLTDTGQVVYRYASEIFSLGQELRDTIGGQATGRPVRAVIGVAGSVHDLVARRLLAPAWSLREPLQLTIHRAGFDVLCGELASHAVDLVVADRPAAPDAHLRASSTVLGQSEVVWVGRPELATRCRRRFPQSLDGTPVLLPTPESALRRALDPWLEHRRIRPHVIADVQDDALLEALGEQGLGAFAVPTMIADEVCRRARVKVIGPAEGVSMRFYAIAMQRRTRNPLVQAIAGQTTSGTVTA